MSFIIVESELLIIVFSTSLNSSENFTNYCLLNTYYTIDIIIKATFNATCSGNIKPIFPIK